MPEKWHLAVRDVHLWKDLNNVAHNQLLSKHPACYWAHYSNILVNISMHLPLHAKAVRSFSLKATSTVLALIQNTKFTTLSFTSTITTVYSRIFLPDWRLAVPSSLGLLSLASIVDSENSHTQKVFLKFPIHKYFVNRLDWYFNCTSTAGYCQTMATHIW